jgi:hypothetical protein
MAINSNLVHQKRMSSMENIQVSDQWTTHQKNLQFNQGIQFRKKQQPVVNNYVPPPQPINHPTNQ